MHISCEICVELITIDENVEVTNCGHIFHSTCIRQWFQHGNNTTCPHCRNSGVSANLIKLFFNSAENENVHLNRNCDAVQAKDDLEMAISSNETLKIDLKTSKEEIETLKTKLFSLEDSFVKLKSEMDQLNVQLNMAINENESKDKEIKAAQKQLENLEKNIDCKVNPVSESKSNNESLSYTEKIIIKNLKEHLKCKTNELSDAKAEINNLKCIQQALVMQNIQKSKTNIVSEDVLNNNRNTDERFRNRGRGNRYGGRPSSRGGGRNYRQDDLKKPSDSAEIDATKSEKSTEKKNINRRYQTRTKTERKVPNNADENNAPSGSVNKVDEPWYSVGN